MRKFWNVVLRGSDPTPPPDPPPGGGSGGGGGKFPSQEEIQKPVSNPKPENPSGKEE